MRTAPSAIKACLREAAIPLHLPGLYRPLNSKRLSPRSRMYSASRKCLPLLRHSILKLRRNQMWCIMYKLATPQELAGLLGPRICGTTGGPPQPHLRSQRGARSFFYYGLQFGGVVSFCCLVCVKLLGNVVRVYPKIVQGLTFLTA